MWSPDGSADWRTDRRFCPRVATKFMILMDFLTSIFPNHSSEAPWLRLSDIDYVFFFFTTTCGTGTITKHASRVPPSDVLLNGTCIFIFSWMEESHIFSRICLPSDSFVFTLGRIFFPRIPAAVLLGGWGIFKDKKKRERKAHWSQRCRITIQSQAVSPLGLRSPQCWWRPGFEHAGSPWCWDMGVVRGGCRGWGY